MKLLNELEIIEKYKDGRPFYCCYHIKSRDFISHPRQQKLKFVNDEWLVLSSETDEILSRFDIDLQEQDESLSRYACFETEKEVNKYYFFYQSKYLNLAIQFETKQLEQLMKQLIDLSEKYDNKDCQD